MLERSYDLLVDAFLNDEGIDDRFDAIVFVFIKLNVTAKVFFFPVNSGAAISVDANLFERVFVVFTVDSKDRSADFDFGAFTRPSERLTARTVKRKLLSKRLTK